jgi:aryl-alcohol dehydrogenase-like predicted oxidoreductase
MHQVPRIDIRKDYSISRILKGSWHLSTGHNEAVDRIKAIDDMAAFIDAGITAFDCADHYLGVEQLIGDFRRAYPDLADKLQIHTKYVPDLNHLATLTPADTVRIIDRSLVRLGVERLDLVQFFWWDWNIPGARDVAMVLGDLITAGKIARLGVTNFNVPQFSDLLDTGVEFIVHQLQYSLVDRRPEKAMLRLCRERDVAVLTYGHLLGGFISRDWIGKPEPQEPFTNRSLRKYKLIIDDFGGWKLFQQLLIALEQIGKRHGVGPGEVALRWTLDQPGIAGCIVGATSTRHLASNTAIFGFELTEKDRLALDEVCARRTGPMGDCYELESDRFGRHGRIMRHNQNQLEDAGEPR